jgi:hypothetical protein
MELDPGETYLATIGLGTVVTGTGRLPWSASVAEDCLALPFRWRKAIRAFLRSEAVDGEDAPDPMSEREAMKVADALTAEPKPDELAARLSLLPDDLQESVMQAYAHATEAAREALPLRPTRQTSLGPVNGEPSDMEVARWRLSWSVLDRPGYVLAELARLRLVTRQVRALGAGYPTLEGVMRALIASEAANYRVGTKAELPRIKDAQLRLLMGVPPYDVDKVADMQKNFAKEPKGPAMPTPDSKAIENIETSTQRVANK